MDRLIARGVQSDHAIGMVGRDGLAEDHRLAVTLGDATMYWSLVPRDYIVINPARRVAETAASRRPAT